MKKVFQIILFLSFQSLCAQNPDYSTQAATYILMRHGEVLFGPAQDEPHNPYLSDAGEERARLLAKMLRSEKITRIFSTDLRRTKQTVAPLSEQQKIPVELYDKNGMEQLAAQLKMQNSGVFVICGHSNTTPQMVALLGGAPGEPIDNNAEFDRLYILTKMPTGEVRTLVLRYGASYQRISNARSVAITIDDLPTVTLDNRIENQREITQKLLATLKRRNVPAIGFVNETKLYAGEKLVPERLNLLRDWVQAGMELGNHTFSHRDYNNLSFEEFSADIKKGAIQTSAVLAEKDLKIKYFRHPYLHSGNTAEKKSALTIYLKQQGYVVAPVTFDNAEYIFARAYDLKRTAGDSAAMRKIGEAYVVYMEEKTAYFETQSVVLFGREIRQTLLIHANNLNADYLDPLLTMFRNRGYGFIPLSEALADTAYQTPDEYIGNGGISWLHRWALTRKVDKSFFKGEPPCPEFIQEMAGMRE